jgi:hypothetical protein
MAGALSSQSLVEPSMSVKRKVRVPVGGLATATSMSSLLPSRGHYSSGALPGPSVRPSAWKCFATLAEHANPVRTNLCERVTDGAPIRALRSHNPPNPVCRCCPMLRKPLIQGGLFAGACMTFLRIARQVVSKPICRKLDCLGFWLFLIAVSTNFIAIGNLDLSLDI